MPFFSVQYQKLLKCHMIAIWAGSSFSAFESKGNFDDCRSSISCNKIMSWTSLKFTCRFWKIYSEIVYFSLCTRRNSKSWGFLLSSTVHHAIGRWKFRVVQKHSNAWSAPDIIAAICVPKRVLMQGCVRNMETREVWKGLLYISVNVTWGTQVYKTMLCCNHLGDEIFLS